MGRICQTPLNPAVGDFEGAIEVRLAVADRRHDARFIRRSTKRFENDHDGIEVCAFEIWIRRSRVAAAFRGVGNRYVALLRPPLSASVETGRQCPHAARAGSPEVKLPVGVGKSQPRVPAAGTG